MDSALIGLAGVIGGLVLGGTGKYFTQRRDAWLQARASGLLLLADIRALCDAQSTDAVVAETELGTKSWESERQALAGFRRGSYPSGLTAPEWLRLARHFTELNKIYATPEKDRKGDWWTDARCELVGARELLARFGFDPPVLWHVIKNGAERVLTWLRSLAARRRLAKGEKDVAPPPRP
jgi:hypothetical protein